MGAHMPTCPSCTKSWWPVPLLPIPGCCCCTAQTVGWRCAGTWAQLTPLEELVQTPVPSIYFTPTGKGLHQEGRSMEAVGKLLQMCCICLCCPEGVAADATLSGTAGGIPIPSVETLGKSSLKF